MNTIKDIIQTLGIALVIGLVVFCLVVLVDRNAGTIEWNKRTPRMEEEAERVSENLDKYVKKGKRIYNKIQEVNDDETPPKPTTPPKTTPARPAPAQIPVAAPVQALAVPLPSGSSYTIQVGRLSERTPDLQSFGSLQDLGSLNVETTNKDRRVLLGSFANRVQVDALLAEVRKRGYSDAFVTTYKPQNISTNTGVAAKTKETASKEKITQTTVQAPSGYVVQVVANRFLVLSTYKGLVKYGTLYKEYDAPRDLTKILLGTFENEVAAQKALEIVRSQGFDKAFVRPVEAKSAATWKKL